MENLLGILQIYKAFCFVLFSDFNLCYFYLFLGFFSKDFTGWNDWSGCILRASSSLLLTCYLHAARLEVQWIKWKHSTLWSYSLCLIVGIWPKKFYAARYVFWKPISNLGHSSALESGSAWFWLWSSGVNPGTSDWGRGIRTPHSPHPSYLHTGVLYPQIREMTMLPSSTFSAWKAGESGWWGCTSPVEEVAQES